MTMPSPRFKQLTDVRNIGLYIFALIVLAITWSGVKTVQNNYELQKQISTLKQQNAVIHLQNQNTALQNRYFETEQYLELAARQNLGLAAPGEKVLIVPKSTALKYIDTSIVPETPVFGDRIEDDRPRYIKNLEDWRNFLLGRKLFEG
jgi:cell division protein FtsB